MSCLRNQKPKDRLFLRLQLPCGTPSASFDWRRGLLYAMLTFGNRLPAKRLLPTYAGCTYRPARHVGTAKTKFARLVLSFSTEWLRPLKHNPAMVHLPVQLQLQQPSATKTVGRVLHKKRQDFVQNLSSNLPPNVVIAVAMHWNNRNPTHDGECASHALRPFTGFASCQHA